MLTTAQPKSKPIPISAPVKSVKPLLLKPVEGGRKKAHAASTEDDGIEALLAWKGTAAKVTFQLLCKYIVLYV